MIRLDRSEAVNTPVAEVFDHLRNSPDVGLIQNLSLLDETVDDDLVAELCCILLERPAEINVRTLVLRNNDLRRTDALASLLENNMTITSLDLSHNNLGSNGVSFLLAPLFRTHTSRLTSLHLSFNNCQNANDIAILLQNSTTIRHLYLDHNPFGPRGIQRLANEGIRNITAPLETLSLSRTGLDNKGINLIITAINNRVRQSQTNPITTLILSGNHMKQSAAEQLSELISSDTTIRRLDLACNNMISSGVGSFSPCLSFNRSLIELNMGGNSMGDPGALAIARALQTNPSVPPLQSLDLSWNQIQCLGASELAQVVRSHPTLLFLNLSGNHVARAGGVKMAKSLPYNGALKQLDLSHNQLCDTVAKELAIALTQNGILEAVKTQENQFSEEGLTRLSQAWRYRRNWNNWLESFLTRLRQDPSMTELDLLSRDIGDDEVVRVASELKKGTQPTKVHTIFLQGEDITSRGISALLSGEASQPAPCPALKRLFLRSIHLGSTGIRSFAGSFAGTSIRELSLLKCGITDTDVGCLANDLFREGTQLSHLNLQGNSITGVGFRDLMTKIRMPHVMLQSLNLADNCIAGDGPDDGLSCVGATRLVSLRLDHNQIEDEGACRLGRSIPTDSPLRILMLQGNNLSSRILEEVPALARP